MSNPMEKSMQGTSEFVQFEMSMQKSMMGSSEKIPISNASTVNRTQQQRDMKAYKQLTNTNHKAVEEQQGDDQNQFLNVGKWNKSKQSDGKKNNSQSSMIKQATKVGQQQKPKMSKASQQSQQPAMVSKWSKKSSNQSGTTVKVVQAKVVQPTAALQTKKEQQKWQKQSQAKPQMEQNKEQQIIEDESLHVDQAEEQQIDENEEEQDEEEEQSEQQQQQEQEEEDEQQDEQQDEDDEEEEGEDQEQIQQQEQHEQEEEPIMDKFATGANNQFQQSSDAYKTETMHTSALNTQPKPSKWNKKAPLQTMTKYEAKKSTESEEAKKGYLSRVAEPKNEVILQSNNEGNNDEWNKIEKVLLRLKLLLA